MKNIDNDYTGFFTKFLPTPHKEVSLIRFCGNHASYVTCENVRCGSRVFLDNEIIEKRRFKRLNSRNYSNIIFERNPQFQVPRDQLEDSTYLIKRSSRSGKVVGGGSSQPRAWPWLIALFK